MKRKHSAVILAAVAFGLPLVMGASKPQTRTITCHMVFGLSSWSAIHNAADGSGSVNCSNGQNMRVKLEVKGGALSPARHKLSNGQGKFNGVTDISQILGTYAMRPVPDGAVISAYEAVMRNGHVSLALSGQTDGWDIGVGLSGFTVRGAG